MSLNKNRQASQKKQTCLTFCVDNGEPEVHEGCGGKLWYTIQLVRGSHSGDTVRMRRHLIGVIFDSFCMSFGCLMFASNPSNAKYIHHDIQNERFTVMV